MSSIVREGDTYDGIGVDGRGVFTYKNGYLTYAGQHRRGYACGRGVLTRSDGDKYYAEHGPDGLYDGRNLDRYGHGATGYGLWERGRQKESAFVSANGRCTYNGVACAPDDPRLLALIALVAPVRCAPQPRPSIRHRIPLRVAPKQLSDGSAGSFCPRRRWRPPWPPR